MWMSCVMHFFINPGNLQRFSTKPETHICIDTRYLVPGTGTRYGTWPGIETSVLFSISIPVRSTES